MRICCYAPAGAFVLSAGTRLSPLNPYSAKRYFFGEDYCDEEFHDTSRLYDLASEAAEDIFTSCCSCAVDEFLCTVEDKEYDDAYDALVDVYKEIDRNVPLGIRAVGLPLTSFGLYKQEFLKYLSRFPENKIVTFEYENRDYSIRVTDIIIYPQGYAAIIDRIHELRREPSVIICDIGSWTVDVMRLDRGFPNMEFNRSLEMGMIRCISEISEQIRSNTGMSVTDSQIEDVLVHQGASLSASANRIVIERGKKYAERIINTLLENGLDVKAVPVIFLGGGASLIKNFIPETDLCSAQFITDINANAKGYEHIARQAFPNG